MKCLWSVTKLEGEYDPDVQYFPTERAAELNALKRFGRINKPDSYIDNSRNVYIDFVVVTDEEYSSLLPWTDSEYVDDDDPR